MGEAPTFEGHLETLCLLGTLGSVKTVREGAFWTLQYRGISFSCYAENKLKKEMESTSSERGSQVKVQHKWIRVWNRVLLSGIYLGTVLPWGGFVGGGLFTPGDQWPPSPRARAPVCRRLWLTQLGSRAFPESLASKPSSSRGSRLGPNRWCQPPLSAWALVRGRRWRVFPEEILEQQNS